MLRYPDDAEIAAAKKAITAAKLPRMPEAVMELQLESRKEEPDMTKVAEIISADISLSGTVLKIVNSAQFGLKHKISSIKQGVNILGLSMIKNVVLVAALRNTFVPETEFQSAFWDRATACARAAETLSYSIEGVDSDEAYAAGLFQDAGALVCEQIHPRYPELFQHAHSAVSKILEIDRKMFKTTHVVIGYLLAQDWNLPDAVCNVILNTHVVQCDNSDPAMSNTRALTAIIKSCNFFVGETLHPQIEIKPEGMATLDSSLSELMADEELVDDIRLEVQKYLTT